MPRAKTSVLKLTKVSKEYNLEGEVIRAVDSVSLEIHEGEFVAVVGPSGSGKSTLLHLMGLLDTPSSGTITLGGQDVSHLTESEAAQVRNRAVGFIFQQFNLLPRTSSLDNVLLPTLYSSSDTSHARKEAIKLLTSLGLGERLGHLSNQLSGGQQQRVAIARALINNPRIIFADEPTGNLDSKAGDEVVKILRRLHVEGHTIVLVTHDARVARLAKRQIKVFDGQIISK